MLPLAGSGLIALVSCWTRDPPSANYLASQLGESDEYFVYIQPCVNARNQCLKCEFIK